MKFRSFNKGIIMKFKNSHWQIAYKKKGMKKFILVDNPKWAWAADPFLVEYRGEVYLFAELCLYKSERNGVIGYCKYNGNGFGEWTVSMDRHWHLSYPNVWVEDDRLYMCPESYQTEEVAVYELIEFPDKWRKVHTYLQNDKYVDTTFMQYGNKKYLYTYRLTTSGIVGELLMYEILEDTSLSEPKIISDNIANARPGGNVIVKGDRHIRVSQDSSNGYGCGLVFSEINRLYPDYKETEIKHITPDNIHGIWNRKMIGIHTYNRLGDIEVIDLKYEVNLISEYLARKRVRKVFVDKYK
jgi:hypothetical protein